MNPMKKPTRRNKKVRKNYRHVRQELCQRDPYVKTEYRVHLEGGDQSKDWWDLAGSS